MKFLELRLFGSHLDDEAAKARDCGGGVGNQRDGVDGVGVGPTSWH